MPWRACISLHSSRLAEAHQRTPHFSLGLQAILTISRVCINSQGHYFFLLFIFSRRAFLFASFYRKYVLTFRALWCISKFLQRYRAGRLFIDIVLHCAEIIRWIFHDPFQGSAPSATVMQLLNTIAEAMITKYLKESPSALKNMIWSTDTNPITSVKRRLFLICWNFEPRNNNKPRIFGLYCVFTKNNDPSNLARASSWKIQFLSQFSNFLLSFKVILEISIFNLKEF